MFASKKANRVNDAKCCMFCAASQASYQMINETDRKWGDTLLSPNPVAMSETFPSFLDAPIRNEIRALVG